MISSIVFGMPKSSAIFKMNASGRPTNRARAPRLESNYLSAMTCSLGSFKAGDAIDANLDKEEDVEPTTQPAGSFTKWHAVGQSPLEKGT